MPFVLFEVPPREHPTVTQKFTHVLTLLLALMPLGREPARGNDLKQQIDSGVRPNRQRIQRTVDRALRFVVQDAAKWRSERGCATCHHGAMTVWALSEAKFRGYAVDAETLADEVKWTKDLFVGQFSKPRDQRWGYNFVSLPAMYLATMSDTLPVLSRDEVNRVAVHLERHQESDGVWQMPPPNPNGSPPTYESQETLALWALGLGAARSSPWCQKRRESRRSRASCRLAGASHADANDAIAGTPLAIEGSRGRLSGAASAVHRSTPETPECGRRLESDEGYVERRLRHGSGAVGLELHSHCGRTRGNRTSPLVSGDQSTRKRCLAHDRAAIPARS